MHITPHNFAYIIAVLISGIDTHVSDIYLHSQQLQQAIFDNNKEVMEEIMRGMAVWEYEMVEGLRRLSITVNGI